MDQLVGDDVLDPWVVDGGRRDVGKQGPDLGIRLAADVLPGARPERVVEGVPIGVDEKVDRLGLSDPEQLRGLLDLPLADSQGALAEFATAVVPVDTDDVAVDRLPVEPLIGDDTASLRSDAGEAIDRDPPPDTDRGVREDVGIGSANGVREAS